MLFNLYRPLSFRMNKRLHFPFNEMDSIHSLTSLAHFFTADFFHDTITIKEPVGTGTICHARLEEGLHLRVWNIKVHELFPIHKIPDNPQGEKIFHIAYLLNPEAITVKVTGMEQPRQVQSGMNILFVSGDLDIELEIDISQGLQALDISFSASWLQQAFAEEAVDTSSFIHQLLHSETPVVFFEATTPLEYRLLSKVHQSLVPGIQNLLRLKAGTFPLLADFFSKTRIYPLQKIVENKQPNYDKMLAVEQFLLSHLQNKLPPMDMIAKQNALSESSLKRCFKEVFGKSIYEYYLNLKMIDAKRVLLMSNSSINDIAMQFNYETVSSFIEMFKRHHGVSPGSLRKQKN